MTIVNTKRFLGNCQVALHSEGEVLPFFMFKIKYFAVKVEADTTIKTRV